MLKRRFHLKLRRDFQRLYQQGQVGSVELLLLRARPNGLAHSRVAVVVSTKISKKAWVRNRLRRRLAALLREHWGRVKPGFDISISPKTDISNLPAAALAAQLQAGLQKLGLLV